MPEDIGHRRRIAKEVETMIAEFGHSEVLMQMAENIRKRTYTEAVILSEVVPSDCFRKSEQYLARRS